MTADQLLTLAKMGEVYASEVMGIQSPRIGLLNNGTESGKGTEVCREAYVMLRDSMPGFIGNIEGRDLTRGICDVVVTDGFTGNILLKSIEGLGAFFMSRMKEMFTKNWLTYASAAIVKPQLKKLKKDFDPSEHGGSPLLGIKKPVFKAHGSSDAKAIANAVRVAGLYCQSGIDEKIITALQYSDTNANS